MKNIIDEVILKLKTKKDGFCRITHKKGWLGFLKDGDLVFAPNELHQILRQVINEFPPKGDKLFFLQKRDIFTVTSEKKPYRPEEALERFITASNPDNFYNQVPIGGRKESIDIGIKENESSYVFIELKPWSSTNSPLYAIIESLKNLIEYRIIHENNIKHDEGCKHYDEVNLIILAPQSYYRDYGLVDSGGNNMGIVKKSLNDLSSEFATNISLMALTLKEDEFLDKCKRICEEKKMTKQQSIRISKLDAIPELTRDQWKLVISSNKK
ncbi:MAG TPA: hypothetical protein PKV48_00085 [Thermodesulfobacteriota bacterium]|nr:hypothetical protein [Thermodesulfobacteriota bacterium]